MSTKRLRGKKKTGRNRKKMSIRRRKRGACGREDGANEKHELKEELMEEELGEQDEHEERGRS